MIRYIEVIILTILALISDIRTYKIKNIIVVPFILIGIITNVFLNGINGLLFSTLGFLVPILLLIVFYILRIMGAGDIKLFSAIGCIMGSQFALYTIAYSFLIGGFIAFFLMIIKKNAIKRLTYLFNYIKACFLTKSLLPYQDFEKEKSYGGAVFKFGYAVLGGVIISIIN